MEELEQSVIAWADNKGIFDADDPAAQIEKMHEEVNELDNEVDIAEFEGTRGNEEIKSELGDVLVTAVIQAHLQGLTIADCLDKAYAKISKRKGRMVNGQFQKEED